MTGARPGQVPGPRTSALVQEKLVPVLASPKIQFMSAFPFLEFLGPLEIGDIVWNTLKDTCIWLEKSGQHLGTTEVFTYLQKRINN